MTERNEEEILRARTALTGHYKEILGYIEACAIVKGFGDK